MPATHLGLPVAPMEDILKNKSAGIPLNRIEVEDIGPSIKFLMEYHDPPGTPRISLNYYKHEKGCNIRWTKTGASGEKFTKGKDFMKAFLGDFKILATPPILALRDFYVRFSTKGSPAFPANLENVFKTTKTPIHADALKISACNHEQVMKVLPYFSPTHLKFLCISAEHGQDMELKIEELVGIEQWKQATQIDMSSVDLSDFPVQHFEHFSRAKICYGKFNMGSVNGIIQMFQSGTSMEKFLQVYPRKVPSVKQLTESFGGGPIKTVKKEDTWYFEIPANSERVVQVKRDDYHVYFKYVGMAEVPEGAVIHG
ncbi:hypothetical protein GCK72_021382 [Caenorhabditis remanei]|uniref:DUF38 domain-containing protein n=1 Tax=Caenorhabditis remanei TaxID=31234 RepID=A0A6A5GHZ9_CAERE|nr:hypothetical protein GCK72_021382 [Caenorhabditis remanei]KAF1754818.1 hypothetical protein GCK72_021382 [Caenorhabditis remanei]